MADDETPDEAFLRISRRFWHVVARSVDVVPGGLLPVTLLEEQLVLGRAPDGGLTLLDDLCAHRGVRLSMGDVTDFSNFMGAVIDDRAFAKHKAAIARAKRNKHLTVLAGGQVDDSVGYFVRPTIVQSTDPTDQMFSEEYFGPILAVYVYDDDRFEKVVDQMESFAPYALTGAVIAQDRQAIDWATERLRFAAGNFYVNDKPTGAVVGQQPFGGARASGTNDKAGSMWNLIRWVSPRTVKETLVPPTDYRYPFLQPDT